MARKSATTTEIDRGYKRIINNLDEIKGSFVTIGVHSGESAYNVGYGDVEVALVALVNEFGSKDKRVPERSFLRETFDVNYAQWRKETRDLLWEVIKGKITPEKALKRLGIKMSIEVQNTIVKKATPPNAASTVSKKPEVGNNPLIHTRKLQRSIAFQVNTWRFKGPVTKTS